MSLFVSNWCKIASPHSRGLSPGGKLSLVGALARVGAGDETLAASAESISVADETFVAYAETLPTCASAETQA